MRSRDGNKISSFAIYSIVLLSSLSLSANEYLISYRYVVKDMILYSDSFLISPAMQRCSGKPQGSIKFLADDTDDFKDIVEKNSLEFREYIEKIGLDIDHKEKTVNVQNSSTTILTFKTSCFKVDFNDNFARITHLK